MTAFFNKFGKTLALAAAAATVLAMAFFLTDDNIKKNTSQENESLARSVPVTESRASLTYTGVGSDGSPADDPPSSPVSGQNISYNSETSSAQDSVAVQESHEDSVAVQESHEDSVTVQESHEISAAVQESHEESAAVQESHEDSAAVQESHEESAAVQESHEESVAVQESHEESVAVQGSHEESAAVQESHEDSVAVQGSHEESVAVQGSHEESVAVLSPVSSEASAESDTLSCSFAIECKLLIDKRNSLSRNKRPLVPDNGIILAESAVRAEKGESVFDLTKRVCRDNGIQLEFTLTPLYNSAYIEGIANLYEFDCGSASGWVYTVNGEKPSVGCSDVKLKDGDRIVWHYTLSLGNDVA